jgi:hypothetical protein
VNVWTPQGELKEPVILQIVSIVDVSVPIRQQQRSRHGDLHRKNRMLVIVLTDGHSKATCIEREHIPSLHADIPPGDKVLFQGGEVRAGKILLTGVNIR